MVSGLEKWNSVRVSFCLPSSAAHRLHRLAEITPQSLLDLGLHSVQVEGADTVSVTFRAASTLPTSSSSSITTSSTFNFDTNNANTSSGAGGGHLSDSESRVESGLGSSRFELFFRWFLSYRFVSSGRVCDVFAAAAESGEQCPPLHLAIRQIVIYIEYLVIYSSLLDCFYTFQ